jgi:hypothetical protein
METVDMLISVSLDFYFIYWIEKKRFNKQILILNFKAISTTISPFEEEYFSISILSILTSFNLLLIFYL